MSVDMDIHGYPWIWISMDIHRKSVDMDMDMDVKFHIHGNPGYLQSLGGVIACIVPTRVSELRLCFRVYFTTFITKWL